MRIALIIYAHINHKEFGRSKVNNPNDQIERLPCIARPYTRVGKSNDSFVGPTEKKGPAEYSLPIGGGRSYLFCFSDFVCVKYMHKAQRSTHTRALAKSTQIEWKLDGSINYKNPSHQPPSVSSYRFIVCGTIDFTLPPPSLLPAVILLLPRCNTESGSIDWPKKCVFSVALFSCACWKFTVWQRQTRTPEAKLN